jgi:hypothetical protein
MKNVTVISNNRDSIIEVSHRSSDSGAWIVGEWRRKLWYRKRISSHWFIDKEQAFAFAHELKREHVEKSPPVM